MHSLQEPESEKWARMTDSKDSSKSGNNNSQSFQLMKEYKSIEGMNIPGRQIRQEAKCDNLVRMSIAKDVGND
jgi:hypothetical protein